MSSRLLLHITIAHGIGICTGTGYTLCMHANCNREIPPGAVMGLEGQYLS